MTLTTTSDNYNRLKVLFNSANPQILGLNSPIDLNGHKYKVKIAIIKNGTLQQAPANIDQARLLLTVKNIVQVAANKITDHCFINCKLENGPSSSNSINPPDKIAQVTVLDSTKEEDISNLDMDSITHTHQNVSQYVTERFFKGYFNEIFQDVFPQQTNVIVPQNPIAINPIQVKPWGLHNYEQCELDPSKVDDHHKHNCFANTVLQCLFHSSPETIQQILGLANPIDFQNIDAIKTAPILPVSGNQLINNRRDVLIPLLRNLFIDYYNQNPTLKSASKESSLYLFYNALKNSGHDVFAEHQNPLAFTRVLVDLLGISNQYTTSINETQSLAYKDILDFSEEVTDPNIDSIIKLHISPAIVHQVKGSASLQEVFDSNFKKVTYPQSARPTTNTLNGDAYINFKQSTLCMQNNQIPDKLFIEIPRIYTTSQNQFIKDFTQITALNGPISLTFTNSDGTQFEHSYLPKFFICHEGVENGGHISGIRHANGTYYEYDDETYQEIQEDLVQRRVCGVYLEKIDKQPIQVINPQIEEFQMPTEDVIKQSLAKNDPDSSENLARIPDLV